MLEGKIYVVGGLDSNNHALDTVDVYDPQTNTWATAPPMGTARYAHGVAVLGGKIYAAGGVSVTRLSSVEVFDPQTNSWAAVAPMGTARSDFSLTAARGKLYAVGGSDGQTTLATVEAYDPQQDRWEAMAPMAEAHCATVAVGMA